MKYIVLKNFYDRFDNMKLCKIGDGHEPPNEERANQLVKGGFIKPVPEHEKLDDLDKLPKSKAKVKSKKDDAQ